MPNVVDSLSGSDAYITALLAHLNKSEGTKYHQIKDLIDDDVSWWYDYALCPKKANVTGLYLINNRHKTKSLQDNEVVFDISQSEHEELKDADEEDDLWGHIVKVRSHSTGRDIMVPFYDLIPIVDIELDLPAQKQMSTEARNNILGNIKKNREDSGMSSLDSKLKALNGAKSNPFTGTTVNAGLQGLSKKSSLTLESKTVGIKDMSKLDTVVSKNKDALKLAAKLEVGNTATNVLSNKIKAQLPMMARGYAEHPLFRVAIGNAAAAAITQFAPTNKKANLVGDAMVAASMQQFVQSFDVPALIEELLNGVNVADLLDGE